MKKKAQSKAKVSTVAVDPYLEGFMTKLLDRLVSLEKKVETILVQMTPKPAPSVSDNQKPVPMAEPKAPQRRERLLYEAICADCSKICEVPFKPVEGRAVYCKQCFALRKSGNKTPHGMPVLTPVALPPKPVSKLASPPATPAPAAAVVKKAKPAKSIKSPKKKKSR